MKGREGGGVSVIRLDEGGLGGWGLDGWWMDGSELDERGLDKRGFDKRLLDESGLDGGGLDWKGMEEGWMGRVGWKRVWRGMDGREMDEAG